MANFTPQSTSSTQRITHRLSCAAGIFCTLVFFTAWTILISLQILPQSIIPKNFDFLPSTQNSPDSKLTTSTKTSICPFPSTGEPSSKASFPFLGNIISVDDGWFKKWSVTLEEFGQDNEGGDMAYCKLCNLPVVLMSTDGQYIKGTSRLLSDPLLPRELSTQKYALLLMLLEVLDIIFSAANVSYYLGSGNAIGAHFVHDLLPWDDDVDVFLNLTSLPIAQLAMQDYNKESANQMFSFRHPKFDNGVMAKTGDQIRFYYHDRVESIGLKYKFNFAHIGEATKYGWIWPFIDLHFKPWQTHPPYEPISYRPYGPMILPFPYNAVAYATSKYGHPPTCDNYGWDHVHETYRENTVSADCTSIARTYPWVTRKKITEGCLKETLVLNGAILHIAYIRGEVTPEESLVTQ